MPSDPEKSTLLDVTGEDMHGFASPGFVKADLDLSSLHAERETEEGVMVGRRRVDLLAVDVDGKGLDEGPCDLHRLEVETGVTLLRENTHLSVVNILNIL